MKALGYGQTVVTSIGSNGSNGIKYTTMTGSTKKEDNTVDLGGLYVARATGDSDGKQINTTYAKKSELFNYSGTISGPNTLSLSTGVITNILNDYGTPSSMSAMNRKTLFICDGTDFIMCPHSVAQVSLVGRPSTWLFNGVVYYNYQFYKTQLKINSDKTYSITSVATSKNALLSDLNNLVTDISLNGSQQFEVTKYDGTVVRPFRMYRPTVSQFSIDRYVDAPFIEFYYEYGYNSNSEPTSIYVHTSADNTCSGGPGVIIAF